MTEDKMIVLRKRRKDFAKFLSVLCLLGLGIHGVLQYAVGDNDIQQVVGRHLLVLQTELLAPTEPLAPVFELNCTPRAIDEFPGDFLTPEQRAAGGVVFHIVASLYIFCALAIVCDDYFVASLESICDVLNLQADVAGATFMALGSSAPEFFTTVIGLFAYNSDLKLGELVGSAVFNLLIVIGICGLGSGMIIFITWWSIVRDCIVYIISIIILVAVIYDGQVHWYEAFVMLLCYIGYMVFMYFNKPIGDYMVHKVYVWKDQTTWGRRDSQREAEERKKQAISERTRLLSSRQVESGEVRDSSRLSDSARSDISVQQQLAQGGLRRERRSSLRRSRSDSIHYKISPVDYQLEEYESPLTWPESIPGKVWWVIMLPATVVFMFTIPDCRRPQNAWKRTFLVTFIMAVLWIGGLSYTLVWMITIAGDTIGIPDPAMGLTFVALGTGVPDALSSVFVARDGYGDMAVANAIGSNICDILLVLGLSWFLKTAIVDIGSVVDIDTSSLPFASLTPMIVVIFLLIVILFNSWKLNKKYGAACLLVYIIVIIFGCLYEMNVFGVVNLPPC